MHRLFIVLLANLTAVCGAMAQSGPAETYQKMRGGLDQAEVKALLQQDFDLQRPEVSEFMLMKMNQVGKRGDVPAGAVRMVMEIDPGKALEWLLDNYRKFGPAGRSNLISSLGGNDCHEIYQLLTLMLDDQALVIDEYAARTWPGPGAYLGLRVCDDAYNKLTLNIGRDSGLLPAGLPKRVLGA